MVTRHTPPSITVEGEAQCRFRVRGHLAVLEGGGDFLSLVSTCRCLPWVSVIPETLAIGRRKSADGRVVRLHGLLPGGKGMVERCQVKACTPIRHGIEKRRAGFFHCFVCVESWLL